MKQSPARLSPQTRPSRLNFLNIAGSIVLTLPLVAYMAIAIRTSVNIPYQDDFDSIGDFVEHYASLHSLSSRFVWILTAQHVQYKLIFLNTVVAIQYHVIGHINYRALQLLGDLAIPATVLLLWLIFARSGRPLDQRIWLFIIPCWVFFAVRYSETVNWTMSGLQNLAVIPFAIAAIFFATSARRSSFVWGMIFLALSIAASASGFGAAIVLVILFLQRRRLPQAAIAVGVTVAMAALYAWRYHPYMVYASVPFHAAIKSFALFPFAFLGNCANSPTRAVLLGILLVTGFIFLTARGWYRLCPGSFGGALFCVITSIVVAAGRYRAGYQGALASHYVMYSLLLIALEYIGVARLLVPESLQLRSRWGAVLTLTALMSVVFCLWADDHGYRELHVRQRDMITHLILWQRHPDLLVLVPDEYLFVQQPDWLPIRIRFQQDLTRHISEGIYLPPYTAADPIPSHPHTPSTSGIEDEPPPASK